MKVFHEYGSKERLFEMMNRVNHLNEEILPKEQKNKIIKDFVKYCYDFLEMEGEPENIEISYNPTEAAEMRSFGKHTPATGTIRIVATNRNLADILRTLAHEIVHRKQMQSGEIYFGAGSDGTEIENEANAKAAIIMRKFGRDNPIIFE
jgi:hypothetical protein